MDPKLQEQIEKNLAEALARQPAPQPKRQAAPAPAPVVGTAPAPAPVQSKKPAAPSAPLVSQPAPAVKPRPKMDPDLDVDLKLDKLYESTRALPSIRSAVKLHAQNLGLAPERFQELAAMQGVALDDLDKQANEGVQFKDYKATKADVIGFQPVGQRAKPFDDLATAYEAATEGKMPERKSIELAPAKEAPALVPGFTTGYVVGGTTAEETPEVSKPGEHYYAVAQALAKALDEKPEVAHLFELYGRSIGAGATQKYLNDRTRMLMKDKNIGPGTPDADRLAKLARRQALYEVLAKKTVNQWTPGVFIKDVQATDDAELPGLFAALYPNIELIGFNNKGKAVFREESPAGTIMRALDVVGVNPFGKSLLAKIPIPGQAPVVGMLTKGENESLYEAAARGVQTGANWVEYALDATEGASLPVRGAAGLVGLVAATAHPDITAAAGKLSESGKAALLARKNRAIAKAADPIFERIAKAYNARDFETAAKAEKEAASHPELGIRGAQTHNVIDQYNRADSAIIQAKVHLDPTIKSLNADLAERMLTMAATRDPALAELVYEAAVTGYPHLHFSAAAKRLARNEKGRGTRETLETFLNAGDFRRRIERVKAAKDAFIASAPKTAEEALARVVDDAVANVRMMAEQTRKLGAGEAQASYWDRYAELLEQERARILDDPKAWQESLKGDTGLLKGDDVLGADDASDVRQAVYSKFAPSLSKRIQELKSTPYDQVRNADVEVFDDALRSIDENVSSRAAAAESVRRNLAREANLTITPVDILDPLIEEGTQRLSPMAQARFFQLAYALPKGANRMAAAKEYVKDFQLLDRLFMKVADDSGRTLEDIWRNFVIRFKDKDLAKAVKEAVATPDATLATAKTAAADAKTTKAAAKAAAASPSTETAAQVLTDELVDLKAQLDAELSGDAILTGVDREKVQLLQKQIKDIESQLMPPAPAAPAKAKAGPKPQAAPKEVVVSAPVSLHPGTNAVAGRLDPVLSPDKNLSKISSIIGKVDSLEAGKPFPVAFPGLSPTTDAVLRGAVREELLKSGVLEKTKDGKYIKAAPAAAPAPKAAAVEEVVAEAPKAAAPVEAKAAEAVVEAFAPTPAAAAPVEAKAAEAVVEAPAPVVVEAPAKAAKVEPKPTAAQYSEVTEAQENFDAALKKFNQAADALEKLTEKATKKTRDAAMKKLANAKREAEDAQKLLDAAKAGPAEVPAAVESIIQKAVEDAPPAAAAAKATKPVRRRGLPAMIPTPEEAPKAAAPVAAAVPATMENLGNPALWAPPTRRGALMAPSTGTLQAKVGDLTFQVSKVPGPKETSVYKIMVKSAGGEYQPVGKAYASFEAALRELTPTARGPAPLRSEIEKLTSGRVRPTRITVPQVAPAKVEEIVEEGLDEGVPEAVLLREAEAPAVVEEAAPVAAPAAPVAAELSLEEKLAKAKEELGKITHSKTEENGSVSFGVVDADENFVPKFSVTAAEMQRGETAETLYVQASRGAPAQGQIMPLAKSGARPVNMKPTLAKIEKMSSEGELYQTATVDGKQVIKGSTRIVMPGENVDDELLKLIPPGTDAPTAIVTLFRNVMDPTTLLHEGAHYIRKIGLTAEDMDKFTRWANSKGIRVTHEFGEFKGAAAEIEKAEELFAQAFEQYLAQGEAPVADLKTLFERVKQTFGKVYNTLKKGPLGAEIDPEVKGVFDKLFSFAPKGAAETTFELVFRETFGDRDQENRGGLTALSREAQRRGMPGTSVEELSKKLEPFMKTDVAPDQVVLSFPAPVLGKKDWTRDELLDLSRRVQDQRNAFAFAPLKQAFFGQPQEVSPVETLFTLVDARDEGDAKAILRTAARAFSQAIIGGDIVKERGLRSLVPELRRDIDTAARILENGIGDTITVLSESIREGSSEFLYRFLAGESAMRYPSSGRRVISSGQQFTAGFLDLYARTFDNLDGADKALLEEFASAMNRQRALGEELPDILRPTTTSEALSRVAFPAADELQPGIRVGPQMAAKRDQMLAAVEKFRNLVASEEGGVGAQLSKAMKSAALESKVPSFNEYRFTETLLYLCGATTRKGARFSGTTEADLIQATKMLLEEAKHVYGEQGGDLFARRLSILVGGYGAAARAKAELAGLGLVLTKEEADAFNHWTLAYQVTPEMRVRLEGVMRKFGANTTFVEETILGQNVYIPLQARERIVEVLQKAQFTNTRLTKMGDIYQRAFSFMKKRMTRGNIVIRSRYFMVNTIDHFFQMSLVVGFAPAIASAARISFQNAMVSLPGQAAEMIFRAGSRLTGGRIDRAYAETIRDFLSKGGDATARFLGNMFSVSKYRVEVNDILEGRERLIVLGGHVTTGKRLRETAVAEGILESYNTRRLGQVIRQEGQAFIQQGDGLVQTGINDAALGGNTSTAWSKVRGAAVDLTFDAVDDLGDAWAERERIGAMVTLIEQGFEPRLAARLTVDALYDYAQTMTKGDRDWLWGLMFPFWAFQKNANQQFINTLFSPYGAYRMMVLERFRQRGGELLTELYFGHIGGELGLDVEMMPQDMQETYCALMTTAHEIYGDELPEHAKLGLRMAFTGRASEVIAGKYYELDERLIRQMKSGGVAGLSGVGMSNYLLPRPSKSDLPSYVRDRPGVMLAQRRNAMVRHYSLLAGSNDTYFFAMLPESSVETAYKHIASLVATGMLMGGKVASIVPVVGEKLQAQGVEGTDILRAVQPVLDLERSPIAGPIIGLYAERGYPQRLHPQMAALLQGLTNVPIIRMPASKDLFQEGSLPMNLGDVDDNGDPVDMVKILGEDYVRTVQELNSKDIDPNDLETIKKERFYLAPGGYSIAFENTLSELNKLMFTLDKGENASPQEKTDAMGKWLYALRTGTGLDVIPVSGSKTAQQEEPVIYKKSKAPF